MAGRKDAGNLTEKQEGFAQAVANGATLVDAYRQFYSTNAKPETLHVKASELAASGKVSVRIAELKSEIASKCLWSREDSVKALKKVLEMEGVRGSEITGAIKELNNMHGFNEPIKVDHTSKGESIAPVINVKLFKK